jgi:hypothetical protein
MDTQRPPRRRDLAHDDDELDVGSLKDRLRLAVRSPARHPMLAALTFFAVVVLAVIAAALTPRVYDAEVSILVERSVPLSGIAGTPSDRRPEADPMRGVYEEVMRRDNLVSLVRGVHLVDRMTHPKAGLPGVKQRILRALSGPSDPSRLEEEAVLLLQKQMGLRVEGGTFTIVAQWWDPQTAYDLVELARKNFFDGRNAAEVAIISDGIALLEEHARLERDAVDEALKQFEKAKSGIRQPKGEATATVARSSTAVRSDGLKVGPDPEVVRALEEKRRQVRDVQDDRNRRLAELRSQLAGLLSTYTPAHPSVASVQSKIDALSKEPAVLAQLEADERHLLAQLALPAAEAQTTGGSTMQIATAPKASEAAKALSPEALSIVAPEAAVALGGLQSRIKKYEELMDRISAAKLDLAIADKAFKYRYAIFRPAETPKHAVRGSPGAVLTVGLVLGAIFAMLAAVAKDLSGGRVVEAWQLEKKLGLRLLGEAAER